MKKKKNTFAAGSQNPVPHKMKINVCVCKGKIFSLISLKAADKLKICCKLKNSKKIVILHSWNYSWVYIVWVLKFLQKGVGGLG